LGGIAVETVDDEQTICRVFGDRTGVLPGVANAKAAPGETFQKVGFFIW
jgi:hypothetical protein